MVDLTQFKALFLSEAEDHVQKLNSNLLALERIVKPRKGTLPRTEAQRAAGKTLLDELMRSAHTMKSSAAMMGYKKTAFLTHVVEDVFDYARNDMLQITPKIIEVTFQAIDQLEASLKAIKKTGQESNLDPIAKRLKEITGVATEGTGKSKRSAEGKPIATQTPTPTGGGGRGSVLETTEVEKISHIKVPVERLDMLMELVEELLIDQMRLEQIKEKSPELKATVEHVSRLVADLQYQVMKARLVPVEQIFARFPRLVRDLAQTQKKEIGLAIASGGLELDRTIVDKLGEPLVHLLRNAIDHGVEKSGTLTLKAAREQGYALITVEDDGKGIDFEKVKQAAVRRNIVSARDIEKFDKEALIKLLFHPRLSTKEQITETSGRGIGLSVVKNFTEQLGGRVMVESPVRAGGTRVTLELPLTLAIISGLLVSVKDALYAIPFSSIERSVSVASAEIKSMADQDVAVVDGRNVPLVRLQKVFGLSTKAETPSPRVTMVLVRRGDEMAGLVVDQLVNEQELVVKPLSPILRGVKGFSGATILGDGQTVLILDVMSLLEDTKKLVRTASE